MVSTDGGKHWSEAQLPTLTADRVSWFTNVEMSI